MKKIVLFSSLTCAVLLGAIYGHKSSERTPANDQLPFELSLQSMALDPVGKIKEINGAYIRATFNDSSIVEFYNKAPLSITKGQRKELDAKLEIDPSWVKSDNLEFKLEIVSQDTGHNVVIRCAQISKSLSEYNRSYQCSVPGEATAVLTYRLSRKGDPVGGSPVAKN